MEQDGTGNGRRGPVRATMDLLASTRTAIVLLALIAAAAVVGTVLPEPAARKFVYGRLWFQMLLGLLGLNLFVCIFWRKRIGMARIWSLLTHSGILLVMIGAMVTLVGAERGNIVIAEGQDTDTYLPEGAGRSARGGERRPLGFTIRLVDFRITRYPPVDYLYYMEHGQEPASMRVEIGTSLELPGTGRRLTPVEFFPPEEDGVVEIGLSGGTSGIVPAEVGSIHDISGGDLALRILRYEPSFKFDVKTREIMSDTTEPVNPALLVALVRGGKEQLPRWLFARNPDFGRAARRQIRLRFLHPSCPVLVVDADTASGLQRLRLENGKSVPSPWGPELRLVYERRPGRKKEYESEVEVLEGGQVVRQHVIQVNSPLVHKGTKLSQSSYDEKNLRYTVLGVSRDSGVWFVFAGFIVTMLGLMGGFYLSPIVRQMRAGRPASGSTPSRITGGQERAGQLASGSAPSRIADGRQRAGPKGKGGRDGSS